MKHVYVALSDGDPVAVASTKKKLRETFVRVLGENDPESSKAELEAAFYEDVRVRRVRWEG